MGFGDKKPMEGTAIEHLTPIRLTVGNTEIQNSLQSSMDIEDLADVQLNDKQPHELILGRVLVFQS